MLQPGDYTVSRELRGVLRRAALSERPVAAPLAGVVTAALVRPGDQVAAGQAVARIRRDPFAMPGSGLAAELLAPAAEQIHERIHAYWREETELDLVEAELAVLAALTGEGNADLPLVSVKELRRLRAEKERTVAAIARARRDLLRFGLGESDLLQLREGVHPHDIVRIWKRVLGINGLWPPEAEMLLEALPEKLGASSWVIRLLGEVAAEGLLRADVVAAFIDDAALRGHFVETTRLLRAGRSIEEIRWLGTLGALDPEFLLRAPAGGPEHWDVITVTALPGQRVGSGDEVLRLIDAREMWLHVEAAGAEQALLVEALRSGLVLHARPVVAEAGPDLPAVKVARLLTVSGTKSGVTRAVIPVTNTAIASPEGGSRSWELREGMRYLVDVPARRFEDRFVLPAAAVTEVGGEQIVFVRKEGAFESRPVHVEHRDHARVVIARDGAITAGDEIVVRGAFELAVALEILSTEEEHHHH